VLRKNNPIYCSVEEEVEKEEEEQSLQRPKLNRKTKEEYHSKATDFLQELDKYLHQL